MNRTAYCDRKFTIRFPAASKVIFGFLSGIGLVVTMDSFGPDLQALV